MIDLYTWKTPNGRKASVMLEELGLPYTLHAVDIGKGEQHTPDFVARNPNGRIPVIVDSDGPTTVFESGAILIYLAEKTGKLLAPSGPQRYSALEWLMFQMSAVGPMFGQLGHFAVFAKEKIPYAIERYTTESLRIMGVLDKRLADHEYLAGDYSIADVATYPWVSAMVERLPKEPVLEGVARWIARVGERPAVQRGMKIP
ncbi:MAG: glutathione S-transferase N-terminal domain-containing protein [Byssovorax sp.]